MRFNWIIMSDINRMGIFVFYDASGIVDQYVDVLLNSMNNILQDLVIVVNGRIKDEDYFKLKKYSQKIFIRENYGFDAGGYKDVFTRFLLCQEWMQYNELVLFNDTFYGPFYPWEDVFNIMDKEHADFWGLSRYPGSNIQGNIVDQHIQSFFLVCRKSLFASKRWEEFWNSLEYPMNLLEAISNFEINFSKYFIQNGFVCKAFIDIKMNALTYNINPYLDYAYNLIKDIQFPVLKKKVISLRYFLNAKQSLDYIAENINYDISLIYSNLKRLQKDGTINIIAPFNEIKLEKFYNTYKNIYIYGHGYYGQGMELYFEYKGWKYKGFIISEKEEKDNKIFAFRDIKFNKEDGIILALGRKTLKEVYLKIRNYLDKSQLLFPEYE